MHRYEPSEHLTIFKLNHITVTPTLLTDAKINLNPTKLFFYVISLNIYTNRLLKNHLYKHMILLIVTNKIGYLCLNIVGMGIKEKCITFKR